MKRFGIVFEQEFKETLRSKPFIVISVVFAIILLGIAALAIFVGASFGSADIPAADDLSATEDQILDLTSETDLEPSSIVLAVYDKTGVTTDRLRELMPQYTFDDMSAGDEQFINDCIEGGQYETFIVINDPLDFDCYEKGAMYSFSRADSIASALKRASSIDRLAEAGISGSDVGEILDVSVVYGIHTIGGFGIDTYIVNYIMIIMIFLVISLYGQMVSTRVATEKSSRTMEVLATAVSPGELLCGKVMGVGAAGFLQMIIFLGAAIGMLAAAISGIPELTAMLSGVLDMTVLDLTMMCLYFVLGFLLIAFIYGGLGSMVSQIEDLSGIASLPMYVFMIGYFIAIFCSTSGEPNIILTIASFVPFWSPIVMFLRMGLEAVPLWQLIVSLLLLAGTCVLSALASMKLYRSGMLRYGKPPKLKEVFSTLKNKD